MGNKVTEILLKIIQNNINNYTCNINALYSVYSLCYCTVRMSARELLVNKGDTVSG